MSTCNSVNPNDEIRRNFSTFSLKVKREGVRVSNVLHVVDSISTGASETDGLIIGWSGKLNGHGRLDDGCTQSWKWFEV